MQVLSNCLAILFNSSMGTGNYSVTSNNMKLVHWPLMGGLLYYVQQGGDCNNPPITASVPITVLLYNGPLLCCFNVPIKGLAVKL